MFNSKIVRVILRLVVLVLVFLLLTVCEMGPKPVIPVRVADFVVTYEDTTITYIIFEQKNYFTKQPNGVFVHTNAGAFREASQCYVQTMDGLIPFSINVKYRIENIRWQ